MYSFPKSALALSVITSLLLVGCGGGGSDSSAPAPTPAPTPNSTPTITAMDAASSKERDAFSFEAQASDSDGSISTYVWQQTSGPDAEILDASGATLSLVLPSVSDDETVVFELTVTDNDGATASAELAIDLEAYDNLALGEMADTGLRNCLSALPTEQQDIGLAELSCEQWSIVSLNDISALASLESLTVNDAKLSDISGLSELSELSYLNLANNQIQDIASLNALSALETLILDNNAISSSRQIEAALNNKPNLSTLSLIRTFEYSFRTLDMEWISDLSALTSLSISHVELENYSSIGNLVDLETLYLEALGYDFNSLAFLTKISSLRSLTLKNTSSIADISALLQTTELNELVLSGLNVNDFSQLNQLTKLTSLTIDTFSSYPRGQLDLSAFGELVEMEALSISNYKTTNPSALSNLTKLKELTLENADISALSFISELGEINYLSLAGNSRISDIAAIGDLQELVHLDLGYASNLSDLSPLQGLTELEYLSVPNLFNGDIDVSPLASLSSLYSLDLSGNRLIGTSELASLSELQTLKLNSAGPESLFDVSVFPKLASLEVSDNYLVSALTVLGGSASLTSLDLSASFRLETLAGIESFPNLKVLSARNIHKMSDITALAEISGLEQVDFEQTQLASQTSSQSMRPLASHKGLQMLNLSRTGIRNVDGLDELTNLDVLDLSLNLNIECDDLIALSASLQNTLIEMETQCVDIPIDFSLFVDEQMEACIRNYHGFDVMDISRLTCRYDRITNITGISQFINATNLDFLGNQISDLSELQNMTQLTNLDFDENELSDFTGLSGLTNLETASFKDNELTTIDNLVANLPSESLTSLSLQENALVDIDGLKKFKNLEKIYLDDNSLTSLTGLSGLPSLRTIRASNNNIDDISTLNNLASVNELSLRYNQLIDVSDLASMTSLRYLYLYGNEALDCSSVEVVTDNLDIYSFSVPRHCD